MIAGYLAGRDAAVGAGAPIRPRELDLVTMFADIAELSCARPNPDSHRSPREQFHAYLQSLDTRPSRGVR